MKRKLSRVEHILDGNIVCFVRLEGSLSLDQLRSALGRVQRKHPALRALIREECDGLYYEDDTAPEIPLRIVQRAAEDDYQRECQAELTTEFAYDQPQLRVVWLPGDLEADLVFATSHRICDGMSMLIIVREVLRCIHSLAELVPYDAITTQDIIGNYQPPRGWKRKLTVALINGLLQFVPGSRRAPENNEHHLEWSAGRPLSVSLRQRCKAEGVSVHAALVVALDRALLAVFGAKSPKWIDNQIDPRRGRFTLLKADMLFPGGGGFKVLSGQSMDLEFWARARAIHHDMPKQIEQEILKIPARFHFFEMLRPLTPGQVQTIIRINDALRLNSKLNSFSLSNFGNIDVVDSEAPFRLKDFRLYVHSFKTKVLGMVPYTFNQEMRFYCVSHKDCMKPGQMNALMREFMAVLQEQAMLSHECIERQNKADMKALVRIAASILVFLVLVFVPAGSLNFWQGWVYIAIMTGSSILIMLYLHRYDPELLRRRLDNKEQVSEQKLFRRLAGPLWITGLLLSGLDHQFRWSNRFFGSMPTPVTAVSELLLLCSFFLLFQVLRFNTFAASTVQVEARQRVISSGPYGVVRHPMYSGFLLLYLLTPFALGSYVAVPVFLLLIPVLLYRLLQEEKLLAQELPGYAEYCMEVRYRLIPFVL